MPPCEREYREELGIKNHDVARIKWEKQANTEEDNISSKTDKLKQAKIIQVRDPSSVV